MLKKELSNKNFYKYLVNFLFVLVGLTFLFGRSFMGLYLFGYRFGELLVGFSLLFWFVALGIFISKKYNFSLSRPTTLTIFLVPLSFLIVALVRQNSFLSTYTYKSSSYIWTLSIFFLGVLIYDNFEFDKFLIYLLNPILVIAYLFQVFAIPEFISNFFTTLGDKFEPHKGSDLTLLFVVTFMLNGKFFRTNKNYYAFLSIFSALYLPFLYFKSRASFIAVFLFLIYEIIKNRKLLMNQLWLFKGILVISFSILILLQSVFWVRQSGIIKVYEARENVVSLVKYRTQTTIEDAPGLFWISDGRLYSNDGNLNWRMDIWQDIIIDLNNNDKTFLGYGYDGIIPIMEWHNGYRLGLDGLNEHVHNNWFNIYARGGLFQIFIFLSFYFFLIKNYRNRFKNLNILIFIIPLLFVSFFDASMENAHFPILYYFFLGRNYILGQ